MPRHDYRIENGQLGFSLTDPAVTDVCTATIAAFQDFSCQVTAGALTATSNVTQETIAASWCEPEEQIPQVGKSSYSLDLSYFQDPDVVLGLSRFLWEHDTEEAWFFVDFGDGTALGSPPKAVGKVRLVTGSIGGAGRVTLIATTSLPIVGKPDVCFGDSTGSEAVAGENPDDLSAQYPDAAAEADLTTLKADTVHGDTGSGAPYNGGTGTEPAFDTGTYIVLADASKAHWSGTAWLAGPA
jgi:hypothetical protein